MNGNTASNGPRASTDTQFDILVIGGGISGINTSYRLQQLLPNSTFAVLESRHEFGGTWSQFQYPGVRSDSDLHTFGFPFNPWKSSNTIASGESIMSYMRETVDKFGLEKYMRFGHKVRSADWKGAEQKWRLEVDVTKQDGETSSVIYWTKWLIMGTGYYSYEKPAPAVIPGLENFEGQVVHPQFWPKDISLKDKRVVIIGSGATAITLMPALVDCGVKEVTQLQRSPSYVMNVPQQKPEDKSFFERWAPGWLVDKWKRKYQLCFIPPSSILTYSPRLHQHPSPHSPLQLLPLLPCPCTIHPPQLSPKATPLRLRPRPTPQTHLQPVGTTHVLQPRRRLLPMLQIRPRPHRHLNHRNRHTHQHPPHLGRIPPRRHHHHRHGPPPPTLRRHDPQHRRQTRRHPQ